MSEGERPMEARIEELVRLEEELQQTGAGDAVDGVYEEGIIAGAKRIPAEEVPDDYPVPIDSEQALRIDVETSGGVVETYVEWAPDEPGAGHVERLLAVLGREPDEFANIFGDRVALDYRNGYHGIDPEGTERLQRSETETGGGVDLDFELSYDFRHSGKVVAALVAVSAVVNQLYAHGIDLRTPSIVLLSFLVFPLAVAYDASRMDALLDWNPATAVWTVAAFLPVLDVPLVTAYLIRRRAKRLTGPGQVPAEWLYTILVVGLASTAILPLLLVSAETILLLWVSVAVLLPVAVYFDFEHVESGTRFEQLAWTTVTAALGLFFAGFVAAGAYLYYRTRVLDG